MGWSGACRAVAPVAILDIFQKEGTLNIHTIGVDLGKTIVHVVGMDERGRILVRKRMSRTQLTSFAANLAICTIAMEASCGAHNLGRMLAGLGHQGALFRRSSFDHSSNQIRMTTSMRRQSPRPYNGRRCVLFPSRPRISSICKHFIGFVTDSFRVELE